MNASLSSLLLDTLTEEAVRAAATERREPAWLAELRVVAFRQFAVLPWPTVKDDAWKRTPLGVIDWPTISVGTAAPRVWTSEAELPVDLNSTSVGADETAPGARFLSNLSTGAFVEVNEAVNKRDVRWTTLVEAAATDGERLRPAFERAVNRARSNKFLSLTLATATAGSVLIVPKGQVIRAPMKLFATRGADENANFSLLFVFIDEAAEAHLWEELAEGLRDADRNAFVGTYTSFNLKENAQLSHYHVQHWDDRTVNFHYQDVHQGAFSRFNAIAVDIGGRVHRNELDIHLEGQGAENKVLGVLFGDGEQAFENRITQNHVAPKTTSDIQYRGALAGAAHSFFTGMVLITKDAQGSDAFQSAKSLLLSTDARADAIPNLEILADDVKCSHGAAVGPVDEDQKFYLQTRGVPPDQAEEIIVQGFFEPVIAEVPSSSVQERLRSFVERKLKNR